MAAERPLRFNVGLQRFSKKTRGGLGGSTVGAGRTFRSAANSLVDDYAAVLKLIKFANVPAVKFALEPVLDQALIYVPRDTEKLADSGFLDVQQKGEITTGEVGFAPRGNPDYAIFVHEVFAFHEPPTQWKFLQRAGQEKLSEVGKRLIGFLRLP